MRARVIVCNPRNRIRRIFMYKAYRRVQEYFVKIDMYVSKQVLKTVNGKVSLLEIFINNSFVLYTVGGWFARKITTFRNTSNFIKTKTIFPDCVQVSK